MNPAISVLLLSFNRPHYVVQSINSVLWQTFEDFELLIIDNSTDTITRQTLERYRKDSRVKIYHENPTDKERFEQCIISVLNNKYIDIATGKYIFFFCDDDLLLPNCLEEHYKFAESHGECDTHSGQMWLNYRSGIWTWKELHQYNCDFDSWNSPSCKLTGGAVMFRKDHIVSLGQPYFRQLNPQHCSTADAVFFEDISKKYPTYAVGQTLSIARFHDQHRSFEFWRPGYPWATQ